MRDKTIGTEGTLPGIRFPLSARRKKTPSGKDKGHFRQQKKTTKNKRRK